EQLVYTSPRVPFREQAQNAYRILSNGGTVSPEPIYLSGEGASSPNDMLEHGQVVLLEANNTQGVFVLFTAGDGQGLVFPNPILDFRHYALRSVFPNLTASEFDFSKERIAPVEVSRMPDGRWKVERETAANQGGAD